MLVPGSNAGEPYSYDEKAMATAWRLFVNAGVIDEDVVRPMIARSWLRCRAAGVNPWGAAFPPANQQILREKRAHFKHSVDSNEPVMQMVMALLKCNVSLMDHENFVFAFMSPLQNYPRTYGTYQHESVFGTGNATTVAYECRPVRIDGFEHYRSVAQGYSGVSVPFLDVDGEYFGALCMNSPFGPLPSYALELCIAATYLADDLFIAGRSMWSMLQSLEFFRPLVNIMTQPVVIVDPLGHILLANNAMEEYLPGYADFAYGEQSLSAYLDKKTPLKWVMNEPIGNGKHPKVLFRAPRKRTVKELECRNRSSVRFKNGVRFTVLAFDEPHVEPQEDATAQSGYTKRTMLKLYAGAGEVDYIGESEEWKQVDAVVSRIAHINANAFIMGETGTGKELVARAIHRRSGRTGPFVAVNCGAIPRDLFAAELFGYEPGAFTGAKEEGAIGKVEAANHGTLLLDEIGEMPLDLQVGLLRIIQEQAVTRLGSIESRPLDVRFLAATNQDVPKLIEAREFRADLYYRLSAIEINLPPLRSREDDVQLLVDHFNRLLSESLCLECTPFSDEVVDALTHYAWPGNVRELRNVIERCLILAGTGSQVKLAHLPVHIVNARAVTKAYVPARNENNLKGVWMATDADDADDDTDVEEPAAQQQASDLTDEERADRDRISKLLLEHGGNLSKVASILGVSRTTLYKRLERYHLHIRLVVEVDE